MGAGFRFIPLSFVVSWALRWGTVGQPLLMEYTVKTRVLLPTLLLAAVFVSPASANWFSNPTWGINLHIGSAPSPKPEDVLSGRQPMLVRDADGNVIAMIDTATGKVIATAEPPPGTAQASSSAAAPAPVRAR